MLFLVYKLLLNVVLAEIVSWKPQYWLNEKEIAVHQQMLSCLPLWIGVYSNCQIDLLLGCRWAGWQQDMKILKPPRILARSPCQHEYLVFIIRIKRHISKKTNIFILMSIDGANAADACMAQPFLSAMSTSSNSNYIRRCYCLTRCSCVTFDIVECNQRLLEIKFFELKLNYLVLTKNNYDFNWRKEKWMSKAMES